ncbi:putative membrane protein YfkQ [Paenibacillus glycanilyticus]|uniref:Membrane protein YfkQ n=1 Tax=Paenibacillus glycanilyticus TaxID=126569 RepID=A0ABQ6NHU9_9BACL|nr:spore germination protein [Paenibacillus glycanilyticus]GMK44334.1 putative membrane protein YfkQ [Paenibacillus glycanilyticus]
MRSSRNSYSYPRETISTDIAENEALFRHLFKHCFDIVFQRVELSDEFRILMVYIDGMIDKNVFHSSLFQSWLLEKSSDRSDKTIDFSVLKEHFSALRPTHNEHRLKEITESVLQASLAVFVDGHAEAILMDTSGWEHRGVDEPASEMAIRGPRESFSETLVINTTLIRRRIQTPELKLDPVVLGSFSKTKVVIAYVDGVARPDLIELVKQRVSRIRMDIILDTGFIEEFIEDKSFTPFPQVMNTERPDIVAANLMEGKIAILIDGTPYVLLVPMTFWTAFQAAEDYYERFLYSTLIRWTRFILFSVSLFLPSLYVAITTFHPQLLPTNFLLSITSAREGVPFPAVIEALLMEFLFEGLREAGVRLPKAVGSAVSIVGALVIGEAAVNAGIVSAPMVIIVSITGIASFAIPRYNMGIAFRILRFPLLLISGALGLFGIAMGTIIIMIHMAKLESFGVPFLSPIAPFQPDKIKDVLIRAPWEKITSLKRR